MMDSPQDRPLLVAPAEVVLGSTNGLARGGDMGEQFLKLPMDFRNGHACREQFIAFGAKLMPNGIGRHVGPPRRKVLVSFNKINQ
jgi:hypothetical protein